MEEKTSSTGAKPGEFMATRVFHAPKDLVFMSYTEAKRLSHWWAPKGGKLLACKVELRPGGAFHYGMEFPDGHKVWSKWVYRAVIMPERLSYVASFSDAEGHITPHPHIKNWPLEVLTTVTFMERKGHTLFVMRSVPVNGTGLERRAFEAGFEGLQRDFKAMTDQLTEYLAKERKNG